MIAHLARGLRILGERWWNSPWIVESKTDLALWVRRGTKTLLWIFLFDLVSTSWLLLGIAVLIVVVRALRAATKAALPAAEKPAPTAAPPLAEKPAGVLPEVDFPRVVRDVLGTAPAVHLATLARHLTDTTGRPWSGDQVRAACRAAGIPIRPKVRDLGGDRVSSGVHRDDLPPLPDPSPEEAQKGPVDDYSAGQGGNATPLPAAYATAPTPTVRRVGDLRITSTPDAHNPHRTHVAVVDPTRRKAHR